MPEVRWVPVSQLVKRTSGLRNATDVPVLTLDDLEAWLKGERKFGVMHSGEFVIRPVDAIHNKTLDDLLAQVQAWRGEK